MRQRWPIRSASRSAPHRQAVELCRSWPKTGRRLSSPQPENFDQRRRSSRMPAIAVIGVGKIIERMGRGHPTIMSTERSSCVRPLGLQLVRGQTIGFEQRALAATDREVVQGVVTELDRAVELGGGCDVQRQRGPMDHRSANPSPTAMRSTGPFFWNRDCVKSPEPYLSRIPVDRRPARDRELTSALGQIVHSPILAAEDLGPTEERCCGEGLGGSVTDIGKQITQSAPVGTTVEHHGNSRVHPSAACRRRPRAALPVSGPGGRHR